MSQTIFNVFPKDVHEKLFEHLKNHPYLSLSGLANSTAKTFLATDLVHSFSAQTIIWVVNTPEDLVSIKKGLEFWKTPYSTFEHKSHEEEFCRHEELRFLSTLHQAPREILLLTRDVFISEFPSREELGQQKITLKHGVKIDSFELINFLIESDYALNPDNILTPGQYQQEGGVLTVFPYNSPVPVKVEFLGEEVEEVYLYDQAEKKIISKIPQAEIWPFEFKTKTGSCAEHFPKDTIFISDELDIEDENTDTCEDILDLVSKHKQLRFTSFPDDNDANFFHLRYLSLLKFHNFYDLVNDLKEKRATGWHCVISTRRLAELHNILNEEKISFSEGKEDPSQIHLMSAEEAEVVPHSFQNTEYKILLLTDREIFQLKKRTLTGSQQKVYLDFLTKLKVGDYVVHVDHGIGLFLGTDKRTVDGITREYLKIGYAANDKLYVPIDQAEKTNKYIGQEGHPPRLTRLGSLEWNTLTSKVRQETEKIAQELLELYAMREKAKGVSFSTDTPEQEAFEKKFPYEETPGQLRALADVKRDMESEKKMDRLICGDVGFGKTEVALRAAFKAVQSGKQVAIVSPITILADQHYKTCLRRMKGFSVKIEMLSRFRSPAEQKVILADLAKGKIDIIIGTHRLLQDDVKFQNLGLVIIDEEQRFGVKQKEKLKRFRSEIDFLTMTATPIPRTLNMALNGIRDISTITTPPPGRLPVITEVRRFSENLIKQVIEAEIARGGQIYFLHNRVQTIESMADKLRALVPQARIVVGHGKLSSGDLEERIVAFKKGEYDILVSSTIIENGIDLPNANTLIVNDADQFGLSQLYQLRGRVGRSKTQAYAYMLYHAQRLTLESKKRLRAIVEAAELGSGFQIAMRDLEIRGSGDILGVNQHGAINVVGVTHFLRMLRQAVDELKSGATKQTAGPSELEEIAIELPLSGYIPDSYIEDSRDKINIYQRLSSADTFQSLDDLKSDLEAEYGDIPSEVRNLFHVLELKICARRAGVTNIRSANLGQGKRELSLTLGKKVKPENIFNVILHHPEWIISGNKLKIDMAILGVHWIQELREALELLAKKPTDLK